MSIEMGLRVEKEMVLMGMTQEELGKKCGVSQQNIGQIISGKCGKPRCLRQLAKTIGRTEAWVMFGDASQPELAPTPEQTAQLVQSSPDILISSTKPARPPAQDNGIDELIDDLVDIKVSGVQISNDALKMARYAVDRIKTILSKPCLC
jgi:transcriptional regulator with XRE-family HTH domain